MHEKGQVRNYLLKHNCNWIDFKFNVPYASHMSGAWERQIRTVRNALEPLLLHSGSQLPLSIENICDPIYFEPLTPNHLLTMKPKLLLPPSGRFLESDQYARKRWRRVQFLLAKGISSLAAIAYEVGRPKKEHERRRRGHYQRQCLQTSQPMKVGPN